VLAPHAGGREDWQILLELATGIARRGGLRARLHRMQAALLRRLTPRRLIALALRFGPHGARLHPFRKALSLRELERASRTIDLGPLQPGRLPRRLFTKGKKILLAPEPMLADPQRVDAPGSQTGSQRSYAPDMTDNTARRRGRGEDAIYFDAAKNRRHTFVSLMPADGVPIEEIARLAGHNRTATTELIYRHELRPVITTGAEVMDRILNLRS
jgi:hypothetical protein